jgi:ABC-type Mn2+/Zn2+ transport system permease subunit
MIVIAIVSGFIAVISGLLVSYHHRTAAGATMALVAVSLFFIVLSLSIVRRWLTARLS